LTSPIAWWVLVHLGILGRIKARWRTEYRQAAKHECVISSRFPSLTRVTGDAAAADHGLLSADAPEPVLRGVIKTTLSARNGRRRLITHQPDFNFSSAYSDSSIMRSSS
jgi:hypothetical protein